MSWSPKQNLPGQTDLVEYLASKRPRGRRKAIVTAAMLSIPPSTNNLYWNMHGKGRVKTDDYRNWLETAGWELKAAKCCKVPGHVRVQLHAGLSARRRDLDNILKPTLDALKMWGIIEDDSWVSDISARWDRDIPQGQIAIMVRQTVSPGRRPDKERKGKMSASARANRAGGSQSSKPRPSAGAHP